MVVSRFAAAMCPGLSVAVGLINEVVFSKAFGMADLEQGVPMRTDSVQRLGSLSKPINGTIIMGLVEEDKLALDASIRQYLPELPVAYQKVTLRHLLDHQSGVEGYTNPAEVAFQRDPLRHFEPSDESVRGFSPQV